MKAQDTRHDVQIGQLNNTDQLRQYASPAVAAPTARPARPTRVRVRLECQECSARWRVSPNANDPECPGLRIDGLRGFVMNGKGTKPGRSGPAVRSAAIPYLTAALARRFRKSGSRPEADYTPDRGRMRWMGERPRWRDTSDGCGSSI